MIFGAMRDEAMDEMAATLFPAGNAVILTELDNARAASLDMLKHAVPDSLDQGKVSCASSVNDAFRIAKEVTPADGLICVTGSLYLIGEVRQLLGQRLENVARQGASN